jgi:transposase-like protein
MVIPTARATISAGGRCKFCESYRVVKNGKRQGTQYWLCRDCGRGFVNNQALPKMKFPVDTVAAAVFQYYSGASLNEIRNTVERSCNTRPAYSAIYNWTARLTGTARNEARKYRPAVSGIWIADETIMGVGGEVYRLFDIIDSQTRYLIATRLSATRTAQDIKILMAAAAEHSGRIPEVIITNGWRGYVDGVGMAFRAGAGHVSDKPLVARDSSGWIKLFHDSLKDRNRVMRDFRKPETANLIIEGWLIHYNYFRPNAALNNRTPAEAAGIRFIYGKWLDVLKNHAPAYRQADVNYT